MTIFDYENEVIKVKEHQKKTKCAHCLIMQDQYIGHMTKMIDMMKTAQKTIQYALIDLDSVSESTGILNAKERLETLLPEKP